MRNEFESTLLENCVTEIARLPGIGRKTALRLALHLLRQDQGVSMALGNAIIDMRRGITYCCVPSAPTSAATAPRCALSSR